MNKSPLLFLAVIVMACVCTLSRATESTNVDIKIVDMKRLKPFTAETNYMSTQGYLRWRSYLAYGHWVEHSRLVFSLRFTDYDEFDPKAWQSGVKPNSITNKTVSAYVTVNNHKPQRVKFQSFVRQVQGVYGDVVDVMLEYPFSIGKRYTLKLAIEKGGVTDWAGNIMEGLDVDERGRQLIILNFRLAYGTEGHIVTLDEDYQKTKIVNFEHGQFYLPWWGGMPGW